MKSHAQSSKEHYSKLARQKGNKTTIAGRPSSYEGKENFILADIISKLDLQEGTSVFDVGCGSGSLAEMFITYVRERSCPITLMDVAPILDVLDVDFLSPSGLSAPNVILEKGYFPDDHVFDGREFDRILLYSVLHYTDDPFMVVESAAKLLRPYGKLLLGDLPNINQKGRFLSSEKGRAFDAVYKNTALENIPKYKNHGDFVEKMKANPDYYSLIDDEFVQKVVSTFTQKGYDVFILPQPESLPFSKTRHDMLICRYD